MVALDGNFQLKRRMNKKEVASPGGGMFKPPSVESNLWGTEEEVEAFAISGRAKENDEDEDVGVRHLDKYKLNH